MKNKLTERLLIWWMSWVGVVVCVLGVITLGFYRPDWQLRAAQQVLKHRRETQPPAADEPTTIEHPKRIWSKDKDLTLALYRTVELPIYPAAVNDVKRTEWQDGWNEAVLTFTTKQIEHYNWFLEAIPDDDKDAFIKLVNDHYLDLDEDDSGNIVMLINMNDTFAYACADAEIVPIDQLQRLLWATSSFKYDGATAWASEQRGELPLKECQTGNFHRAVRMLRGELLTDCHGITTDDRVTFTCGQREVYYPDDPYTCPSCYGRADPI